MVSSFAASFISSWSFPAKFQRSPVVPVHATHGTRTVLVCHKDPEPEHEESTSVPSRRTALKQFAMVAVSIPLSDLLTHVGRAPNHQDVLAGGAPPSSHRVYFDVSVAGRPRGRIVIHLFSSQAPASSDSFEKLVAGSLRNRSGRTAGYRYSQASRVIPKQRVYLGRLNQIDAINQSPGTPQRQQRVVEFPTNSDSNELSHDRPGLVSLQKGGSFEFAITTSPDTSLDTTNIVIGEVVSGMEVVEALANVPVNRKTIRDGYRNIGKAIGDARANVQLENKPLQKILITECGLL